MASSDLFEDKNGVVRKRREACKHGHLFDGTERWHYNWKGYASRECRECGRLRMQRKRANPERKKLDAEGSARWRVAHPEKYREGWQRAEQNKKQILLDARKGGCKVCGETHPACLDFHHREPSEKEGHIGEFRRFGIKRLLAEIAKCDVLCANCHRKFHHDERQPKKEGD